MKRERGTSPRGTLEEGGVWYKGNLHSHTTLSDGRLSPEELIAAYRGRGYDFLAITDHNIFDRHEAGDGFLVIPSFEYTFAERNGDYREFHFNVFAERWAAFDGYPFGTGNVLKPKPLQGKGLKAVQDVIDEFKAKGCLVMLNHPHWSLIELEDILPLQGYFGVETYNYSSYYLENMGVSTIIWDSLLRRGRQVWGIATDDNHNLFPLDSDSCDSFGGWVCVKAKELTAPAILDAVAEGSFYSSAGPEIRRFAIEDDRVIFECSTVDRIHVVGDRRQYQTAVGRPGRRDLTSFSTRLKGGEKYVRVECVDATGRRAYTNPIFL